MKNHGGKRKGSGRPPTDPDLLKIPVSYKLPRWLVEWLREESAPASQIIESAILRRHKLKPPS